MSSECKHHSQSRVHRASRYVGSAALLAAFITVPPQQEGDDGAVREGEPAPANWLGEKVELHLHQATDCLAHMWMIKAEGIRCTVPCVVC